MSGRLNNAPAGEKDKQYEESLVNPVVCCEETSDHHGTQIAAPRRNASHLPEPALIGLVRLLARQAAREQFDATMRPDHGGGEVE